MTLAMVANVSARPARASQMRQTEQQQARHDADAERAPDPVRWECRRIGEARVGQLRFARDQRLQLAGLVRERGSRAGGA